MPPRKRGRRIMRPLWRRMRMATITSAPFLTTPSSTSSPSSQRRMPSGRVCSPGAGATSGSPPKLRTHNGISDADNARVNLWIRHVLACKACALQFEILGSVTWLKLKGIHLLFASQHLTRLDFSYVQFGDCFLNFSSCPALQDLHIRRCKLVAKSISSQPLKCLIIADCNSSRTLRTRIHAPNLISLWLDKTFHRAPVLEKMPSLTEAVVTIGQCNSDRCTRTTSEGCNVLECQGCYGIESDASCVLFQGLSTAKNLALVAPPDMFIFRRDLKHCPMFRQLKKLLLNECWCVPDVCALACILQHAPVLEKLTLQLFSKGPTHMVEIKGNPHPKVISAAISQELKIVEVKCEVINETVLNVLKFLSKHNICFSFEE